MDVPGDIEEVVRRAPALSVLRAADGSLRQRELVERLDTSKSTAHRTMKALEAMAVVERTDRGYDLTDLGEVVADETERYLSNVATANDLRDFLDVLARTGIAVDDVADGTVTRATPDNPMAPLMRLAELTGDASEVAVLTSSIAPQSFDVGRRMLRDGDQEIEMILDERTLGAIVESDRYGEGLADDLRERPLDLWIHEGEVPYQVGILDDVLCLGAEDDSRMPVAILETDDPGAIRAAEGLIDRFRSEARRVTPAKIAQWGQPGSTGGEAVPDGPGATGVSTDDE